MDIQHLDHEKVLKLLPERKFDSHKGHYGKILLLCGSVGYTGAAALSAMGALRVGAGLVFLGVPSSIYKIEAIKLTEPIVFPLTEDDGKLSGKCINEIRDYLPRMDAVLIGPGLGQSADVFTVVKYVLEHFEGPIVLDADGINVMSKHMDIVRGRQFPTVLTPHEGEFSKIANTLSLGRVAAATGLATDLKAVVVLKGHGTIITDGKRCYENKTGNPGMAVGGSGDVLAGMITGLIGQGLPILEASACAVWLHGAAGDLCAKEIGQYGMLPTDVLCALPRLLK